MFSMIDSYIGRGMLPEKNYFNTVNDYTDTSIDEVMKKMEHPELCIIKKGAFPQSVSEDDENIKFAFVSLDTDLYIPIFEGLKFFYPRLAKGGYIMVHDYNNVDGVMKAVDDYEMQYGNIHKVPIPDDCGTLVIVK